MYDQRGKFYQCAFTSSEIKGYLKNAGFGIIEILPYDAFKGLKHEITVFKPILNWLKK